MALETLSANELLNFIIYDTISATTPFPAAAVELNSFYGGNVGSAGAGLESTSSSMLLPPLPPPPPPLLQRQPSLAAQGRKKRRRRVRVCKNKEDAENQRMTHITVERNRRKLMNEHLAVLRSLMPDSYVQRGDQASIVGGAIEFVKELEHHLQSLEAEKFKQMQQPENADDTAAAAVKREVPAAVETPFAQFFAYPQYTCSSSGQVPTKFTSNTKAAVADIEVTLIETHANVRILSQRRVRQLSKMVTGLQSLYLSILHLNVTTLEPLVLYSISAKVEEGCLLNSADDIAGAVHHILRIIEEEAN